MNNMNLPPLHNLNELANSSPYLPRQRPPNLGPNDRPRYRGGKLSLLIFVGLFLIILVGWVLLLSGVGH